MHENVLVKSSLYISTQYQVNILVMLVIALINTYL